MSKLKILTVDDDPNILQLINLYLTREGFEVLQASNGTDALKIFKTTPPSLMLLDVMLPGMDGFSVLARLRREGVATPVLMLTARGGLEDRVRGLESGADYYLPKPFQMSELIACLHAITRRGDGRELKSLSFGDAALSPGGMLLSCATTSQSVKLGAKEYQLMELLLRNAGQVLPRETILTRIWGYDSDAEYNNLAVYLSFLRRKLAFVGSTVAIRAVRGVGYALEDTR